MGTHNALLGARPARFYLEVIADRPRRHDPLRARAGSTRMRGRGCERQLAEGPHLASTGSVAHQRVIAAARAALRAGS